MVSARKFDSFSKSTGIDLYYSKSFIHRVSKMIKTNYKIKTVRGDLVVITEGIQLVSMLTNKVDLDKALQSSLAHKWLLEQAIKTKPSKLDNVPSTDTETFKTKAFYHSVKLVVENLVNIEGLDISEAIELGNTLVNGGVIVADSPVVHQQIRDALRYRCRL